MCVAARLTAAAGLAALVAGCGGAATHSSTSPSTHASGTGTTTTATALHPVATPSGFVRYHAVGFSFLAPSGFKPAPNGSVRGLPPGATGRFLTPGGKPVESTSVQILELTNPKVRLDVEEVATGLGVADSNDPALKDVRTSIAVVTVAGAAQARVLTESYLGPEGRKTQTLFRRTWLMVSPRPGLLMDLVVVTEPNRGGKLDPAPVLDSFRLGR